MSSVGFQFKLDHWGYFCVDEERNWLFLASVNDDEPIFRYKFKTTIKIKLTTFWLNR